MAEQKPDKNVELASSSSNNSTFSRIRPIVTADLSRSQNKNKHGQKRTEESISFNTLPYQVPYYGTQHFNYNYVHGQPLFSQTIPWQPYHNNLVYRNYVHSILQTNSSETCFHSLNQEGQLRKVQTSTTGDVKEGSLNGLRFWEQVLTDNASSSGFVFTVMSYNVLAQDLIEQHPYLYNLHSQEALQWQVRWINLINEIKEFSPDILCLQEVQGTHLKEYFANLEKLGYRGLYKQRTGIRTDGCAIYYKDDLLALIEHTTVEFNQPNVRILDRDNVAIIAKFAPKTRPSKAFVVATTHLLYNPRRQDVRLAQTQLLLTEVERLAFNQRGGYVPVIITGDLNSTPDSAVYQLITKGKLRYENLAVKSLEKNTNGPKTGKKFLPSSLRITDKCQHADLIAERESKKVIPRSEEVKLIELRHSERNNSQVKKDRNGDDASLFSSGTISHDFFLKSVYEHLVNGDIEGTTYQNEWISVDYIFYSKKKTRSGKLLLLERYRLPTQKELSNVRIPNTVFGSDHLSLLAKFKLDF